MAEIEEGQFLEFEKRFAAFKHVFNTLQTSVHKSLLEEQPFETAHQIYLDDLITGTIRFSNAGIAGDDQSIQPGSHCAWQPRSAGDNAFENILLGNKYIIDATDPAYPIFDTNTNVEKVTAPLYKAKGTNRQAYFTYQPSETDITTGTISAFGDINSNGNLDITDAIGAYQYTLDQTDLQNNANLRLRNWIAPTRFGGDYTVQIFQSNADYTGPDTAKPLATTNEDYRPSADFDVNNIIHGGYIFDYLQGMMYLAPHPTTLDPFSKKEPYIAGLRHPLWIVGYRYIGPTGSNMTVTGAESAGTANSSGGGGGVSTTLISQQPGHPLAYDTDAHGWYDKNILSATDSEDIIEYRALTTALIVSASFGEPDLVVRLDSSSYNNITSTPWPYYENNDADTYNSANLFKFGTEETPDYSSYGLFRTTGSAGYDPLWITQSFEFTSPIRLDQMALCYSNNENTDWTDDDIVQEDILTYKFPAAYKLEGSVDNIEFTNIATVTDIRTNTLLGNVAGPIGSNIEPNVSFGPNLNTDWWPNNVDETATTRVRMYCATASITDTDRYQYYRLYVSGGSEAGTTENPENIISLHHVDLWQNLDFGPTNRKQLNIKLNDALVPESAPHFEGPTGQRFTEFDLIVSQSAAKLGLVEFVPAGTSFFDGGNINSDLNFPNNSNIKNVGQISASAISASDSITTGQLNAISMSGNGDDITFNRITNTGTITTQNLVIENDFQVNSDVIVPSDKFIFLTNKKQDGSAGTDAFSARIFGNFVEGGGVSDMYLDAYRIYTIADAKMHMRTLHPTLGSIVLQSPITHISGSSLQIDNAITADAGMRLSGSLLISGSIVPNVGPDTQISSFDLGSSTAQWKDLHLSDGTIRLYDGTQEKAAIGLNASNEIEFKSESDEFRGIKVKSVEFIPPGSTVSSVQISDDGQGFVSVTTNGKNSTIFRAEATLPLGERMGSITQKGTGSFAILLDADANVDPHPNAKFVVESNSTLPGAFNSQRLFSVSESFETRIHQGGLRADKYVTTTNITASIISASATITANSFVGTFTGALSSSAQIKSEITGAFYQSSHSLQSRLSDIEPVISGKLLLSGSTQIASNISGAFGIPSSSISARMTVLETFRSTNTSDIEAGVLEYQTPFSSSVVSRVKVLEANGVFTSNAISGAFDQTSGSMQSRLTTLSSNLQSTINATGSYVVTGNSALLNQITASNISASNTIVANTISASNLHTTIFNPAVISTTEFTASLVNLGDLSNTRTFTTDDYNTLFAASTRPALTVRNAGGGNITYFGSPVDNADAFIKFETDRSNTIFTMGIDSHDGTFKIAEGAYLNENSGKAPFNIKNNKVAILQGDDPAYELDVAGDIRSTGTMRVDTIKGQTYPYTSIVLQSNVTTSLSISASGTITANAFVGDGTGLTGIASIGSVVLNSATASFLTESPFSGTMISGSFNAVSNSLESRLTLVEGASVTLPSGLYSSSLQPLGNITSSGNISSSGAIVASNISGTNTGDQNISNLALTSSISGAFAEVSNSLQSRIGTLEIHDHSIFAVKTAVSGAFNGQTSSFALESNVVPNSATSSFVTITTTIDGGTF